MQGIGYMRARTAQTLSCMCLSRMWLSNSKKLPSSYKKGDREDVLGHRRRDEKP